jgi:hypothetical protein
VLLVASQFAFMEIMKPSEAWLNFGDVVCYSLMSITPRRVCCIF